jgi:hypothetical protein
MPGGGTWPRAGAPAIRALIPGAAQHTLDRVSGWLRMSVVVLALTGCRQLFGIDPTEIAGTDAETSRDSANADGAIGPDARTCFGTGLEVVCLVQAPMEPISVQDQVLDTDNDPACAAVVSTTTPACVLAGAGIEVVGRLRVTGSRPLVLVSTGMLALGPGGIIDVASPRGGPPGAGANAAACALGSPATGSGGGAGGSFGAPGGDGGSGASGGARGIAGPGAIPTTLRGGCPGGAGGNSAEDQAGQGGGAVYLIAAAEIRVDGTIDASGGGGAGGMPSVRGGSGGGSGGHIGLDAPALVIGPGARVFANGGGGGEGAGTNSTGGTGDESPSPFVAGQGGGNTNPNAGDGGDGGYAGGDARDGVNGVSSAGGGGGGGSAGVISVFATTMSLTGQISPAPS